MLITLEKNMSKAIDITGQKFDRLTAIRFDYIGRGGNHYWLFKCDCGNYTIASKSCVKYGTIKSCGCLNSELTIKRNTTHGMSSTRFYRIFYLMKGRCYDKKNDSYKYYGQQGIRVCDRWLKFENFRDDMYESYQKHAKKYGEKDTSINRERNTENYCFENCEWNTQEKQQNNRRNNHKLTYKGQTLNICQWAKKFNINRQTLSYRIDLGWSMGRALKTPTKQHK